MENLTKFPIFLLKIFGSWQFEICKMKPLKFLYLSYKAFILSVLTYGVCIYINLVINFNFQKYGLADNFKPLMLLVTLFLTKLIILESIFAKNEWQTILQEFEEVEKFFGKMNFEMQKLSNIKKFLISSPMLAFVVNIFLNASLSLFLVLRVFTTSVMFVTNYSTVVLYITFCWNVKNRYRNLILYLSETRKLMIIKKAKVFGPQISKSLQIIDQIPRINSSAHKFFMLRITTITGKFESKLDNIN